MQINYGVRSKLARALEGIFSKLRLPKLAPCWEPALLYCLGELAKGTELPQYVRANFLALLASISKVTSPGAPMPHKGGTFGRGLLTADGCGPGGSWWMPCQQAAVPCRR